VLWLLAPAGAFEFYKEGFSRSLPAEPDNQDRTETLWRLHATPQLQPFLKPTPWLVKGMPRGRPVPWARAANAAGRHRTAVAGQVCRNSVVPDSALPVEAG
jgi:hypothetical protein